MFEETPHASGLAAGFFFSGRRNQFAAIRIALARKTGILPRNVSSTLQPRLRPESGAFSFCVAAVSDSWSARRTRSGRAKGKAALIPPPAPAERCNRVAHGGISLAYVPRRKAKPLKLRHGYGLAER